MLPIITARKSKPKELKFSDIVAGQVYTYGSGRCVYMRVYGDKSVCLTDATVSGVLDDSMHYGLRILEAELHVKD